MLRKAALQQLHASLVRYVRVENCVNFKVPSCTSGTLQVYLGFKFKPQSEGALLEPSEPPGKQDRTLPLRWIATDRWRTAVYNLVRRLKSESYNIGEKQLKKN